MYMYRIVEQGLTLDDDADTRHPKHNFHLHMLLTEFHYGNRLIFIKEKRIVWFSIILGKNNNNR